MKPVTNSKNPMVMSWGENGRPPYNRKTRRWVLALMNRFYVATDDIEITDWEIVFDLFTME